ncbi:pyruvate, phosphate dikinase [Thermanaerosceptrum fracticalcis]|uniref:Pyruvate, phosphate dikinase n=1 Tax=Thermanaerosceptrum fracticalcis TaxID=1712410 RepID=A0A7G6E207_THEFR|nr:pyruvate, phosphate dikinase [Thermanaerosceptrum fracticalcis]QNB46111.1 pyruvate, phosphate dikinase [Thermanaerosceptrum fracticalcis]
MKNKVYVYLFEEGKAGMKSLLGGKGANLAEMTNIGLPVPPGLTITTEACNEYFRKNREFPEGMEELLWQKLKAIEEKTGKIFGDPQNPLLVSVRSGAVVSMPGMMDTILNLGLNDETVEGLAQSTQNRRFALDCYRRFIQMFSDVVLGVEHFQFETALEKKKHELGVEQDQDLTPEALAQLIKEYKTIVKRAVGQEFPGDPKTQLLMAVRAVFNSWHNPRAEVYRRINKIPADLGTAVNVQSMVFGNMGNDSGTGVAFTRNPSNGERVLYGEYLINAQGEDVVAGIRTPQPIQKLEEDLPQVYEQFVNICRLLENHYRDMQDIEFTIERGKLYMLQTRNGKRTAHAAIKIAVDMVEEGLITREEAISRIDPASLDQLLHRRIDTSAKLNVIAKGLPASPGAASGQVVFDADKAEALGKEGKKVILVRTETTPDDIHGIVMAQGILTSRGGMTSHAAVVARGMGKCCVCGCESLKIDYEGKTARVDDIVIKEHDIISLDGSTGAVMLGEVKLIDPELSGEFQKLLTWADEIRVLGVRANADNPQDAAKAREFGAKGIGLCRTEHMFMAPDRIPIVQEMIMAETYPEREKALEKLLPMQEEDFYGILKVMSGYPVTIRLLDPPLHEFLPNIEELVVEITQLKMNNGDPEELSKLENILRKARTLHEFNPMLGHRGCRLGISYPEIYRMQARAIFQAVVRLTREGFKVIPEVEIPLVIDKNELAILRRDVEEVAQEVMKETGLKFEYTVGTMIELPRACLTAGEIAEVADFFAFGTNDLTQTTLGFSRDDAEGKFMNHYLEKKILTSNPFIVLDREGVGKLMELAVKGGREKKPGFKVGICGEHGGEPSSIEFCHLLNLDYVSCSPFRVPIARLAAAQAKIKHG